MICCLFGHKHRSDYKVVGFQDQYTWTGRHPRATLQGTCLRCGVAFEKTYAIKGFATEILIKRFGRERFEWEMKFQDLQNHLSGIQQNVESTSTKTATTQSDPQTKK